MSVLTDVLVIVLILSATALSVYLIISLKKLLKSVGSIQADIHNIAGQTAPLLKNLSEISERANKVVTSVENRWDEIDDSIQSLQYKINSFFNIAKNKIDENPISRLLENLKSVRKGIATFWSKYND